MTVTRTYGQLHFKDLGWERFESLVLGMVFKWRRWESINHIGIAGDDGGVDIEAVELLDEGKNSVYHFQCKRYEKIGAAKIRKILDDYCDKNPTKADKYVLVTACSLSASCLNAFKAHANLKGLSFVEAWTKPELEAMLYTHYYDLLYIFFGISVTRQRSNRISSVRRNISLKHKMEKDFKLPIDDWHDKYKSKYKNEDWRMYRIKNPHTRFRSSEILIRSIDDTGYPENNKLLLQGHYGYEKAEVYDFYHNGLIVHTFPYRQNIIIRCPGYDGGGFLFMPVMATVLGYIPYNNIIDYDIDGDGHYTCPHVFCDYANGTDPFEYIRYAIEMDGGGLSILRDERVAEISKTERVEHIKSLLSADYEEYDEYSGNIVCSDCAKTLRVNRETAIENGAWSVYHISLDTFEIGEEQAVCYDCYQNHCIVAEPNDMDALRNMEKAIEDTVHPSNKNSVGTSLRKLTDYSRKEGKSVRKAYIVQWLGELLKVNGTPDFDTAVATLVDWFKPKLI